MAAGIVIAVILLACTIRGFVKGGVRTIFSVAVIFIGIIAGTALNPTVTGFLNDQVHLNSYIEETVDEQLSLSTRKELNKEGADVQKAFINELKIPATWKKFLIKENNSESWGNLAVDSFTGYIARMVAEISVKTISFIMTFLLVVILLEAVSILLGIVDKIPILGDVNKLVGGIMGLVHGLLLVGFIMVVVAFGKNYAWGTYLYDMISQNAIASFFYKHNLIFWILSFVF